MAASNPAVIIQAQGGSVRLEIEPGVLECIREQVVSRAYRVNYSARECAGLLLGTRLGSLVRIIRCVVMPRETGGKLVGPTPETEAWFRRQLAAAEAEKDLTVAGWFVSRLRKPEGREINTRHLRIHAEHFLDPGRQLWVCEPGSQGDVVIEIRLRDENETELQVAGNLRVYPPGARRPQPASANTAASLADQPESASAPQPQAPARPAPLRRPVLWFSLFGLACLLLGGIAWSLWLKNQGVEPWREWAVSRGWITAQLPPVPNFAGGPAALISLHVKPEKGAVEVSWNPSSLHPSAFASAEMEVRTRGRLTRLAITETVWNQGQLRVPVRAEPDAVLLRWRTLDGRTSSETVKLQD